MTTLKIEGRMVKVSDDFLGLPPDEQERTVEEIAASFGPRQEPQSIMSNVNRGIADAAGGIVDLINPFDQPHALNPIPEGTGSAREGLKGLMERGGIDVAEGDPDGLISAMARGSGEAAGSLIPVAKGLQALRGLGGTVGKAADEAFRALSGSMLGVTADTAGGAVSQGAAHLTKEAGGPEWAQQTAAVLAPASIPAGIATGRAAAGVAGKMPGGRVVKGLKDEALAAVAPYTKSGAQAVASKRVRDLAGGDARAEELAQRTTGENPLALTPAQMTGDQNMIALEQMAASRAGPDGPNVRVGLQKRADQSRDLAETEVRTGAGSVAEAQEFFTNRRAEYAENLQSRVSDIVAREQRGVEGIRNMRDPGENSVNVMQRVETAFDDAKLEERSLWEAVPKETEVPVSKSRDVAARWRDELGPVGDDDIPAKVKRWLLDDNDTFTDGASVRDMHRLYSSLRETARNARAGNNVQRTMAKVADEVADAILDDIGQVSSAGDPLAEARAFSAAMHETFDQGAVGRLLKRTTDGDTSTSPELALERTVGRGGTQAGVASRELEAAADSTAPFVMDYIKGRFNQSAISPEGQFTQAKAHRFTRDNKELLDRYPELRDDIREAVAGRESAERLAQRVEQRLSNLASARKSATAAFLDVSPEKAFTAITSAKNPVKAARSLANEARKDKTGKAMAGLKDAFSGHLISSDMTGDSLAKRLSDPKTKAALRQIYTEAEMSRFNRIARELGKLDAAETSAPSVGDSLSGAKANKLIEFALRVVAANQGAQMGEGAASLQTAQMASGRMKALANRLTADKASQMISDAITDPDLFRALLLNTKSPGFERTGVPLILPYVIGGTSAAITE